MFDETPTTEATPRLASTIPPEANDAVRRWRTAAACHTRAAQLRADLLEQPEDATRVRSAATRKARTTRLNAAWRRQDDIAVKRTWLAMQFGQWHGLHFTRQQFGPADAWPYPEGDHVDLYERNGRAACAVAHVYCVSTPPDRARAACEAFADRAGLRVTFPRYPSWGFPGETLLVAYWPGVEEEMF